MSVQKLSISFDQDLAEQVRDAAGEHDESISAFLAEAARARLRTLILESYFKDAAERLGVSIEDLQAEGEAMWQEHGAPAELSKLVS